jgi:hypothetical protein
MSISSALRSDRLKRLHSRFLEAGEGFPTLCHAAVCAQSPHDWKRILPAYLYPGKVDDKKRHEEEHDDFLRLLVSRSVVFGQVTDFLPPIRLEMTFDSKKWVGIYLDPKYSPPEDSIDDPDFYSAVICFEQLGADALAAFRRDDNSEWSGSWIEGRNPRWLETVYETSQVQPEIIHPTSGLDGGPVGEVAIASLHSNVFVASAKAVERLAEDAGKTVSSPRKLDAANEAQSDLLEPGLPASQTTVPPATELVNASIEAVATPPVTVDEFDVEILNALASHAPIRLSLQDLTANTEISRKTIGQRLKSLIDHELACRPDGDRKGATITDEGKAYLRKLTTP